MLQGCRLFKWHLDLPAGHCVPGVPAVLAVAEPPCQALCCRGASWLSGVKNYLLGTVLQGCRLYKWCRNLPAGHCVARAQAVLSGSEPSSRALLGRGAGCLSGVRSYLLSRLEGRNWILFYFYFRTDQVKPWHMHLLLLRSAFFF